MKLIKIHWYLISANYLHINWLAFLSASSLINSIPNMWNWICKLVPGLIKCSNLLSIHHFVKHNNERHFGDNWFEIVTIWRHYHHHWHIVANLMLAFSGPKHETNQFDSSRIRSQLRKHLKFQNSPLWVFPRNFYSFVLETQGPSPVVSADKTR